jgi:hypothetical protein
VVQIQPRQIVYETLSKIPIIKGLVEWLKVKVLSSRPSTKKKKGKPACLKHLVPWEQLWFPSNLLPFLRTHNSAG